MTQCSLDVEMYPKYGELCLRLCGCVFLPGRGTHVLKSYFHGPKLIPLERGSPQLFDDVWQPISRRPLNFCCIFNCVLKNMPLIMWGKQNLRAVKELFHILGLSFHVLSQSSEYHTAWICWHFKLVFASPALYTILILVYPILLWIFAHSYLASQRKRNAVRRGDGFPTEAVLCELG